ncbi:MAG TPA: DNA ligase D [Polyangiaceae bacterium]|jgi:bifunctional non-homologous end joining protein LigD
MPLKTYRSKRDFRRTHEPRGDQATHSGFAFVVQRHDARSLHFDFRLELDGVLLSWAVPKGPSDDPSEKRLAMQTEDHPVEYATFEGTIPEGEYGAGTVEIWDRGRWQPRGDPRQMYEQGRLHFELFGERLHGGWHLVRTRSVKGAGKGNKRPSWLLFKAKEAPHSSAKAEQEPRDRERISSKRQTAARRAPRDPVGSLAAQGAVARATLPKVELARAVLVRAVPAGDEFLHEAKYDGYRMQCRIERGGAQLLTRYGHDWTARFEPIARAALALPVKSVIFDGELIALGDQQPGGDFQKLQNAMKRGDLADLRYVVFDLLYLDGWDLRRVPLEQRKQALASVLAKRSKDSLFTVSEHVVGNGPAFFEESRKRGLEGVVSKRRGASYGGRKGDWLKTKYSARQEFVVVGFTDPGGSRQHFGALLLGVYDGKSLRYAGKVGAGFSAESLREIYGRLRALSAPLSSLDAPPRGAEARGVHWLEPELVAEIEFSEFTADGRVRHPTFKGLREDKPARAITPERPVAAARTDRAHATERGHQTFALTNPDKVLYPEPGYTKSDLANYYSTVAQWILPHVVGRPLTLVRCPNGCDKPCFFQKHPSGPKVEGVRVVSLPEKNKQADYVVIDDLRGLLSLVQWGALEIHTGGAQAARPNCPDLMVFDLDPDLGLPFSAVAQAALKTRQLLKERGLTSFVKTTGGKGLHVCVPLDESKTFEQTLQFSRSIAEALVHGAPDHYVVSMSKSKRSGKVFIDYLRNGRGATFIAPYSTRKHPSAPVAMPLHWDELDVESMPQYTLANAARRLAQLKEDPWRAIQTVRQALPPLAP